MPRSPNAGLRAIAPVLTLSGISLSAPVSSVLKITGLFFIFLTIFLYAKNCSFSVGKSFLSAYKYSVLKSPTPSIFFSLIIFNS